ncbi:MAG: TylF/MycF/NovP-related O-methyltransferase [Bacteroidota bacterium]
MPLPRTLRPLKRLVWRTLLGRRRMVAPSFSEAVHHDIQGRLDYARAASLALALARIDTEAVPGSLAEVGVFRGETSGLIRAARPDRTLYLFDTFDGFPEEDLESFQRGDSRFQDTSLDIVRRNLGTLDRVVIRPGRVPESLSGLEDERFAFVLLDMDLRGPTAAALEFFYSRLSTGGYLFVHDYNNPESDYGCRKALDAFLQDKPEPIVELPDIWGSAVFRKI